MASDSTAHDRLNAELVQLMRQQTGTYAKEVEVMGRTFLVLPEVFSVGFWGYSRRFACGPPLTGSVSPHGERDEQAASPV